MFSVEDYILTRLKVLQALLLANLLLGMTTRSSQRKFTKWLLICYCLFVNACAQPPDFVLKHAKNPLLG